jgi:hypothetical protein
VATDSFNAERPCFGYWLNIIIWFLLVMIQMTVQVHFFFDKF